MEVKCLLGLYMKKMMILIMIMMTMIHVEQTLVCFGFGLLKAAIMTKPNFS
jgi:hypothetical protein